jgi:hypothetical protein
MPGIFNARADEALYAASCHSFGKATRNQRFQYPGLPAMNPEQRDEFVDDSISRFITGSMGAAPGTRIGAFTTADAIAQPGIGTYSVFADAKYSDESWRAAFSPVELTAGTDTWEIHQVDNPVTWQKIAEGGQVRAQSLTSEKATYGVDDYATELAFTYRMMRGRVLYQFIAALNLARDSYLATLSEAHYAVLATASITGTDSQISWKGAVTDSNLDRDIATINAGLSQIASDLKDVAPGLMNARYLLYVPEALEERAIMTLRARNADLVSGRGSAIGPVPVKRSLAVAPTLSDQVPENKGLLVFPGRKLQAANDGTDLDTYSNVEGKTRSLIRQFWARWGIAAADSKQVVELSFS